MELSYAAYNPIANSEVIPGVPGSFREPPFDSDEWTVEADLISKGFEATSYNYDDGNYDGLLSVAAHTIGHREIIINENTQNSIIVTNGDEDYGYNYIGNTGATDGSFSSNSSTDKRNTSSDLCLPETGVGNTDLVNITSSINENNTDNTRQLVVVSVRGSVTPLDWLMDFQLIKQKEVNKSETELLLMKKQQFRKII